MAFVESVSPDQATGEVATMYQETVALWWRHFLTSWRENNSTRQRRAEQVGIFEWVNRGWQTLIMYQTLTDGRKRNQRALPAKGTGWR